MAFARATLALLMVFGLASCGKKTAVAPEAEPSEPVAAELESPVAGSEGDPDAIEVTPAAGSTGGGASLLAEATQILNTMSASTYSHHTHVEGGVYDVDCSGFVDYLLGRVAAPALNELRAATVRRPLAKHFVQFLAASAPASRHWQRVARVSELEPGDIIAWLKPTDLSSTNTGHVMIVAGALEARPESRWSVPIIDSSAAPHGKHDARKLAHTTGIGRGTIVLEADSAGAPIAYHWTTFRTSPRHETTITLGRVR